MGEMWSKNTTNSQDILTIDNITYCTQVKTPEVVHETDDESEGVFAFWWSWVGQFRVVKSEQFVRQVGDTPQWCALGGTNMRANAVKIGGLWLFYACNIILDGYGKNNQIMHSSSS